MGVSHILYIFGKLMGSLFISIVALFFRPVFLFPGADMYLIDTHGGFYWNPCLPLLHPGIVSPFKVGNVTGNRCGSRTKFCLKCIWVSLKKHLA